MAAFLQLSLWSISGVRQVNRMRHRYLAGVLRQDVGYFDKEATSGKPRGGKDGRTPHRC